MWERSFVAMSVLLSVPLEEALAALPAVTDGHVQELSTKLRQSERHVRANALADVAKEIAWAVAEVERR